MGWGLYCCRNVSYALLECVFQKKTHSLSVSLIAVAIRHFSRQIGPLSVHVE